MAASSKDAYDVTKGVNGLKVDDGTPENEVRITSTHKMRNYVTYCLTCFEEKGYSSVTLKAMGRAITKAVIITEVVKRHIAGLHQTTSISSVSVTDSYEPQEEGLDPVNVTRYASVIDIQLSKEPLDAKSPGYQAPLPEGAAPLDSHDEAELLEEDDQGRPIRHRSRRGARDRGPRGRGGGGRARGGDLSGEGDHQPAEGDAHHEEVGGGGRGRARGRGRGRGRFRGRGRGRGRGGGGGGGGGEGDAHPAEEH